MALPLIFCSLIIGRLASRFSMWAGGPEREHVGVLEPEQEPLELVEPGHHTHPSVSIRPDAAGQHDVAHLLLAQRPGDGAAHRGAVRHVVRIGNVARRTTNADSAPLKSIWRSPKLMASPTTTSAPRRPKGSSLSADRPNTRTACYSLSSRLATLLPTSPDAPFTAIIPASFLHPCFILTGTPRLRQWSSAGPHPDGRSARRCPKNPDKDHPETGVKEHPEPCQASGDAGTSSITRNTTLPLGRRGLEPPTGGS